MCVCVFVALNFVVEHQFEYCLEMSLIKKSGTKKNMYSINSETIKLLSSFAEQFRMETYVSTDSFPTPLRIYFNAY